MFRVNYQSLTMTDWDQVLSLPLRVINIFFNKGKLSLTLETQAQGWWNQYSYAFVVNTDENFDLYLSKLTGKKIIKKCMYIKIYLVQHGSMYSDIVYEPEAVIFDRKMSLKGSEEYEQFKTKDKDWNNLI